VDQRNGDIGSPVIKSRHFLLFHSIFIKNMNPRSVVRDFLEVDW